MIEEKNLLRQSQNYHEEYSLWQENRCVIYGDILGVVFLPPRVAPYIELSDNLFFYNTEIFHF